MTERVPQEIKDRSALTKEEWREYTKTVWQIANVTDKDHPAVFPEEIPRRLIRMFSFVEETVLDPFAGIGTTARVALGLERNAICVEQNESFANRITSDLQEIASGCSGKVVVGDSRNLDFIADNSIDLVVTSPPYWNKADYGEGAANLGAVAGYREFLHEIRPVFSELVRVLRPGRKLCVVTANVNQYTEHGLLTFPLAADFATLMRDLGLVMINELIWSKDGTGGRWGSSKTQRPIFGSYPYPPNFLFKNVHEYVLIFAKEEPAKYRRGQKVVQYGELMKDSNGQLATDTDA